MRRKGNEGDAVDGGEGTVAAALQVISREYARLIREKSQWDEERKKLRQRISFLEGEKVGQDSLIQMLRAQVDSLKSRVKGATGLKRSADKTASKTATFAEFQERYRSLSNRSWMKNFSGRSSYKPILRKFIKDLGIDVTDREENRSSWSKTLKPKSGAGITASSKVGKKSNTITSAESSSIRERRSKTQVVSRKKYEKKSSSADASAPVGMTKRAEKRALPSGLTRTFRWKQVKRSCMLRSHIDSVRSLAFSPSSSHLISGGDDGLTKLWRMGGKSPRILCTYRGHKGSVFATTFLSVSDEQMCASAGSDGIIRLWSVPQSEVAVPRGETLVQSLGILQGHTDAVWSLASMRNEDSGSSSSIDRLLSASADGSVRLWDARASLRSSEKTIAEVQRVDMTGTVVPVCAMFSSGDSSRVVYGTVCGGVVCAVNSADLESGKNVVTVPIDCTSTIDDAHIYQIASHPTRDSIVVSAHEDGHLRLCDLRSGKIEVEILAHRDAASCIAVGDGGAYVVSGSHDGSVRVWSLGERKMVQDLPDIHLRNNDESVNAVAMSSGGSMLATGGGDTVINVHVRSSAP